MDTKGDSHVRTFPNNILVFDNKVGTVQFWPTSDDTFNMFYYCFQQYDKDGNLILWGRLNIKKEAAGKDRGQSFLWQLHRNTELLD
ncbi:MAG: hypothetical protein A2Y07_01005 [Planctomycetes bacterium GWF2_50_10]|nr:MAG: hypothetical protein A2Y07_01005 [Planctomycetes bacterium GWF2_50_10]